MKRHIAYILIVLSSTIHMTCHHQPISPSNPHALINREEIPSDSVLLYALSPDIPALREVYASRDRGEWDQALESLAAYMKERASERYYFSWKEFDKKFQNYKKLYPGMMKNHLSLSKEMKSMYSPDTQWQLPFKNLRGEEVTAYRLRHLARQSKSFDMVLSYFEFPQESGNLCYWIDQMADLNQAFMDGEYDQGGNAVYEVFRAGKRTHQWLEAHHAYLSVPEYTWQDQIETMRTMLHTAAQLAENGKQVRYGNHHTRGMVGLFEIAASFPEYAQSSDWLILASSGVTWHLEHEINADGFQFERSVHYHKSDIENYLRVWQLAQRGGIELPQGFESQFRKMFDALVMLAQPDRHLPVLQDDTDRLHAEVNEMGDVMSIGSILWQDPGYYYFTDEKTSPLFYWILDENDLAKLKGLVAVPPELSSVALEATGYYVMRNGWEADSEYMVITAGLSDSKPDHQHPDMLGVVAYANGNEILPNYQVKYDEPDFPYWKSSWVKNVALIDSLPQTQQWKGNAGGSGFGKWLDLPQPIVNASVFGEDMDYFSGSHDGYKSLNISYKREVLFVKDGFWIVSDFFENPDGLQHDYQQLWQGKYTPTNPQSVTAKFDNGASFQIRSLNETGCDWIFGSYKEKGSVILLETSAAKTHRMTTLLLPAASAQTGLPSGWKLIVGSDLRQAFPDLARDGVTWVFQKGKSVLYLYEQADTLDKNVQKTEPGFVFVSDKRVTHFGPQSPELRQDLNEKYFKE